MSKVSLIAAAAKVLTDNDDLRGENYSRQKIVFDSYDEAGPIPLEENRESVKPITHRTRRAKGYSKPPALRGTGSKPNRYHPKGV